MPYLKINGYPVKTRAGGEVSYDEIAGHRQHSFNGLYQFSRNALARRWQFTTIPLPKSEALALAGMINMQGEAWRWSLGSTAPDGVHYLVDDTSSIAWTDKRRTSQNLETVATLVSAFGADGARVYDWNGNAYAPFSGCDGAVLVEPGTTNKFALTTEGNVGSGSVTNPSTEAYWQGANSVKNVTSGTTGDQGYLVGNVTEVAGGHVLSAYVKFGSNFLNKTWNVAYYNATTASVVGTPETLTPTLQDAWYRVKCSGSTTVGNSVQLRIYTTDPGTTGTMYIDGVQWEVNPGGGYPTAYVEPSTDPWGSGNGIRPAGVLDYDTFLSTYTKGITVSAWVNFQRLSPAANRYIFDGGDSNPRCGLYLDTSNRFRFFVLASDGSGLDVVTAAQSVGILHAVATYNPLDATARVYVNGALAASDSTWSGARQKFDVENTAGDLSIGTAGSAGSNYCPGPIGPVQVFPFAAPLNFITGLYNSGGDQTIVPGLMPLGVSGTALGAGETEVACYGQVNAVTNVPHYSDVSGAWEDGGATVTFTLVEATGR